MARVNQQQETAMTAELAAVAEFRSALRAFLRRSAAVSSVSGLTPQRYDLLLQIHAGFSDGEATVSGLSERLALPQPAVTELVKRAERSGLVARRRDPDDGRVSRIRVTAEGERRLLATFEELSTDRQALLDAFAHAARRLRASWRES